MMLVHEKAEAAEDPTGMFRHGGTLSSIAEKKHGWSVGRVREGNEREGEYDQRDLALLHEVLGVEADGRSVRLKKDGKCRKS